MLQWNKQKCLLKQCKFTKKKKKNPITETNELIWTGSIDDKTFHSDRQHAILSVQVNLCHEQSSLSVSQFQQQLKPSNFPLLNLKVYLSISKFLIQGSTAVLFIFDKFIQKRQSSWRSTFNIQIKIYIYKFPLNMCQQ